MNLKSDLKITSFEYGERYQNEQLKKYLNKETHIFGAMLKLVISLFNRTIRPELEAKNNSEISIMDVGCSIGTYAIEFSKLGYKTYGVDFDKKALQIAKDLSESNDLDIKFFNSDVSELNINIPDIDVFICVDILEHLHDDEIGALLNGIKKNISKNGFILFLTSPLQFDYIFYSRSIIRFPLLFFKFFKPEIFTRFVKIYASFIDILLLLFTGKTYKERIKKNVHPNPLTKARLTDIFNRAGFKIICIETGVELIRQKNLQRSLSKQPIAHRSMYGVVKIK